MRHSAWLAVAPRKPDPKAKAETPPRYITLADSSFAELPPVDEADYLLELLFDIGPVSKTGFGVDSISETELMAWQHNRQTRLTPWECEMIRKLSKQYAAMLSEATDPNCQPPYSSEVEQTVESTINLRSKFKNFAQLRQAPGVK